MKVFLSYSRIDMLLADTIVQTLRDVDGIIVERDLDKSSPGAQLGDRLRTQISESDVCFFLVTPASVKSKWVNAEHSWARQLNKKIVLLVQHGVNFEEIPDVDAAVEHIQYEPTRYSDLLIAVKATVLELRGQYGSNGAMPALVNDSHNPSGIRELRREEIDELLSLSASNIAEALQPYIADSARRAVESFFGKPEFTRFINIGTLETDAQALVIRAETLHALMAAAAVGTPKEYRAAGYRAGVSFGLGVVKWFLEKTKSVKGVLGLPKSGLDLIRAATKIDDESGWGRITQGPLVRGQGAELWSVGITVERDFLSAYHNRREPDDIKTLGKYGAFWSAYLEGTYSTALAVSHGLRSKFDGSYLEPPVLTRVTQISDDQRLLPLQFKVSCINVHYRSAVEDLCREVLCPYILGEFTRVVSRARTVVEGFVRALASVEESKSENIMEALRWLARDGPESAREVASHLQKGRNELNKGVHVGGADSTDLQAYSAVQATAPGILKGVYEIQLTDGERNRLRQALSGLVEPVS